jgi:peptidoglycan hydrolase-like protein with peptidoglycan-binding domain
MLDISEYMGAFEAQAIGQPSQSGLVKRPVAELQAVLHKVGWTKTHVVPDGKYGPKTKLAWEKSATKRKLNPTFDRAGPTEAWVDPQTYAAMAGREAPKIAPQIQPKPAPRAIIPVVVPSKAPEPELPGVLSPHKPFVPTKAVPESRLAPILVMPPEVRPEEKLAAGKLVKKSVAELQAILHGLGWSKKKVVPDGLFGAKTRGAWAQSATKRGMVATFKRVNARTAAVDAKTYVRLDAQSRKPKPPPPKPLIPKAPPVVQPGTVVKDVAELQALLYGVGWTKRKLKADGLYGPQTKRAWGISAKSRKLNPRFERVTGKTARVDTETYAKIRDDARKARKAPAPPPPAPAPTRPRLPAPAPVPVPAPVPPRAPTPVPSAVATRPVAELQTILHRLGWSKQKVVPDGLFGPKTQRAWGASARKRKLDTRFKRVAANAASVNVKTYLRMKAEAVKTPAPAPKPKKPSPPLVTPTVKISVLNVQGGLNGQGVKPMLDVDGKWGARTQQSFVAWLRKQPGGKEAKFSLSKNRQTLTLPRAYGLSLVTASKGAPLPPARVSIVVVTVKRALGDKGTLFTNRTKALLDNFVKQTDHGIHTGYRVSKDKKTVLRIRQNIADKLKNLAVVPKAPPPPGPLPPPPPSVPDVPPPKPDDPVQIAIRAVVKQMTVPVPVLHIQQAMAVTGKHPEVKVTGVWDKATERAFLGLFQIPKTSWPVRLGAFPLVLSVDRRTMRLTPKEAAAIKKMSQVYRDRQVAPPEPIPEPEPPRLPPPPEPTPEPPLPEYVPPEPEYVPAPPAPQPLPPPGPGPLTPVGPSPEDLAAWNKLVQGLETIASFGPKVTKVIEEGAEVGLSPEAKKAYQDWIKATRRLFDRVAMLIAQSPELRQAMDAAGAGMGFEGNQLEAYFAELASAAMKAVDFFRKPLPAVTLESGFGVAAPAAALVAGAPAAAGWAVRFAGPVWRGLLALLKSPVVTAAGATAIGVAGLKDVVHGETQAILDHNARIAELLAKGLITEEEAEKLREKVPEKTGIMIPIIMGAVALGAFAIFMEKK